MAILVERESLTTKSRHVSPSYVDQDGNQYLASSDRPFPIIDVNHLRLHEGRAYYVYKLNPDNAKLATSASIDIAVAWPAGITPHAVITYQCGGEAEFYMYESPTTSSGTAMTIYRRNRSITSTSTGAAVLAPTVTALGTEIYAEFISSGQGGTGAGGAAFTFEYVFKPLTTYLFRLTNVNGQAQMAEIRIDWYE
jgi:hypothetical protein